MSSTGAQNTSRLDNKTHLCAAHRDVQEEIRTRVSQASNWLCRNMEASAAPLQLRLQVYVIEEILCDLCCCVRHTIEEDQHFSRPNGNMDRRSFQPSQKPATISRISRTCSFRSNGIGLNLQHGSVRLLVAIASNFSRPTPFSINISDRSSESTGNPCLSYHSSIWAGDQETCACGDLGSGQGVRPEEHGVH